MTAWVYDDGGRRDAGHQGDANDCVVRAFAIALQLPYQQVYDELADRNLHAVKTKRSPRSVGRRSARDGLLPRVYKPWLAQHDVIWTPTMFIGSGCKVHVRADELPGGRLILNLSRHLSTMIDGVVHDTFDPSRDGTRCVYGYWTVT